MTTAERGSSSERSEGVETSSGLDPVDASADLLDQREGVGTEPAAPPKTPEEITGALEALLLMAEEPVPAATFAAALEVPIDTVTAALQLLRDFYDDTNRGFELRHLGGGWRYYTRAEHAEVISGYVLAGQQAKLSQAALETLAVIAYRQPISRARVSAVRGVNVDGVVRTLLARNLIAESGHDVDSTAVLFVTTDHFLERMGMDSLEELPPLAPYLPEVAEMEAELAELAAPSPVDEDHGASGDRSEHVETSEPVETTPDDTTGLDTVGASVDPLDQREVDQHDSEPQPTGEDDD